MFINPFQILTKQQAAQIRLIRGVGGLDQLYQVAQLLQEAQLSGLTEEVTFNMVVPDQVADLFKSNGNLKVTDSKTGQPTGFTLLQKIDWY